MSGKITKHREPRKAKVPKKKIEIKPVAPAVAPVVTSAPVVTPPVKPVKPAKTIIVSGFAKMK
jgi:hypothetical protein